MARSTFPHKLREAFRDVVRPFDYDPEDILDECHDAYPVPDQLDEYADTLLAQAKAYRDQVNRAYDKLVEAALDTYYQAGGAR